MHIPDAMLSNEVALATGVVSAAAVGASLFFAGRNKDEKRIPVLGVTGAFVFAAQMLNFPVPGGTSGHFMGGALAAIVLGPLEALLILAVVLLIQCLAFADGGLTALGANTFNMGIVGGVGAWLIFAALRGVVGFKIATALAAWLSIMAAAAVCATQLVISGRLAAEVAFPAMLGWHAMIGVGEAAITVAAVTLMASARPDLVPGFKSIARAA